MKDQPLRGVRVIDFTWNVAGPTATRVLALLGAAVIKVEWPARTDPSRVSPFAAHDPGEPDSNGFFADLNIGKLSCTLNPTDARGAEVINRLLAASDLLVESYSPRVMAGWGWTWERLKEISPGLSYVSVSGFGHTGPYKDYVSYGPTAQAASGMTYASGLPGREPAGWGYSVLDVLTGYEAASASLAALHERRRTGRGQRVDLSQVETGVSLLGPVISDFALNGVSPEHDMFPPGNRACWPGSRRAGHRYESGAPYGLYRTHGAGPDEFCAICVLSQAEWHSLCRAIGRPDLLDDARYATPDARIANQDSLDLEVERWTQKRDKYAATELLQSCGVRATPLQSGRDRLESDQSLRSRHVFQEIKHPVVGTHRFQALPLGLDGSLPQLPPLWPLLGQHTSAVLTRVAGLTRAEVSALAADGVTWPASLSRRSFDSGAEAAARDRLERRADWLTSAVTEPGRDAAAGHLPLSGMRVVELDDGHAQFAGKLLADLGATVTKVEPAGGSRSRREPPFLHGVNDLEHSLPFWYYNAGKQSVAVAGGQLPGREIAALLRSADVLLDGSDDPASVPGLTSAGLSLGHPQPTRIRITPFGSWGAWSTYRSSDLASLAAGGVAALCGYDATAADKAKPVAPTGGQARHFGGFMAAIAALAFQFVPPQDRPRQVDIAIHDVIAVSTEIPVAMWEFGRRVTRRHTARHVTERAVDSAWQFACRDGSYLHALTMYLNERRFAALLDLFAVFGLDHGLDLGELGSVEQRDLRMPVITEAIGKLCALQDAESIFAAAQERALPWSRVAAPRDIPHDPQIRARASLHRIEVDDVSVPHPGTPWHGMASALTARRGSPRRRPPRLGEDNYLLDAGATSPAQAPSRGEVAADQGVS